MRVDDINLGLRVRHLAPIVDRQSRRIVPSILQSSQSREEFVDDLLLTLRAVVVAVREDAAHDARSRIVGWLFISVDSSQRANADA